MQMIYRNNLAAFRLWSRANHTNRPKTAPSPCSVALAQTGVYTIGVGEDGRHAV
jgi:hypothetical protein